MEKIFNYKNGKIKLSYNEQFEQKDYEETYLVKDFKYKTRIYSEAFSIGMELMVHKGGRICYGMLVAQVRPHEQQNVVKISITTTLENVTKYEDSILLDDRYVYKGLPQEYVEHMLSNVEKSICEKETYPQVEVSFDYAANCEVGSSSMIFGYIAEIIMDLLASDSIVEMINMDIENFTEQFVSKIGLRY